ADIPDANLTADPTGGDSVLRVEPAQLELTQLRAIHTDDEDAEAATQRAKECIDDADLGDEDAELALGDCEDNLMSWYDSKELGVLVDLMERGGLRTLFGKPKPAGAADEAACAGLFLLWLDLGYSVSKGSSHSLLLRSAVSRRRTAAARRPEAPSRVSSAHSGSAGGPRCVQPRGQSCTTSRRSSKTCTTV